MSHFTTHKTPIHDRITPEQLAVRLSDPRYSEVAKKSSIEFAANLAERDGDDAQAAAFRALPIFASPSNN